MSFLHRVGRNNSYSRLTGLLSLSSGLGGWLCYCYLSMFLLFYHQIRYNCYVFVKENKTIKAIRRILHTINISQITHYHEH